MYVHGDGSGTQFRFCIDDSVDVFPVGRGENHEVSEWKTIDWVGWRLVEWDLENDPIGTWIGNGKLEGTLRFDSFQLKYVPGTSAPSGQIYFDHLQLAKGIVTGIERIAKAVAKTFELYQNYPNPFNPETWISYEIPQDGFVNITIFDLLGRQIRTLVASHQLAGRHSVRWDGRDENGNSVPSGFYIYRLNSGSNVLSKKMTLVK